MARVRYIGAEPVTVPELGSRTVQPDEIVEVPDARFDGYVCQTAAWEGIEEPQDETAPAPLKKTTAVKAAPSSKEMR
ncbi:hypothetical protein ACZ90_37475 [Streptomyces albus subsp. albus]|uniref:hypothetical protein n=1 Tax=Streptomyces TaxID=1883 RepID=UPI0004BD6F39|nr:MULTISPECIES: hypothetical protein [Streptomyces]KOG81238.1 hypothetical protein ADK33_15640 [Streptomyces griseus subsp. rhodochrous]KUJ66380.1 hypothetical protein ACZ90_37475 [Streptomyces albus subsp. albus]